MNTQEMQERLYRNKLHMASLKYRKDMPDSLDRRTVRKLDERKHEPEVRRKHNEGFKPQLGFHIFAKQPELFAYMQSAGFRNRLRRPTDSTVQKAA